MLSKETRTLRDVQAVLMSMFHAKTVLVGHSLESDLKALKLIHDVVVDTSILFPHKMGPPKKRALKTLCIENLKRIIQENGKYTTSRNSTLLQSNLFALQRLATIALRMRRSAYSLLNTTCATRLVERQVEQILMGLGATLFKFINAGALHTFVICKRRYRQFKPSSHPYPHLESKRIP